MWCATAPRPRIALIFVAENARTASPSRREPTPASLPRSEAGQERIQQSERRGLAARNAAPDRRGRFKLAANGSARVILNPAPARPLSDALLRRVYLLTPNETEAELLTA